MIKKKIVIATDSFKGCLKSSEVEDALAEGLMGRYADAEIIRVPATDGGDGMLEAIANALQARYVDVSVHDALMRPVMARYAITDHGTAVIESAKACGISLLTPDELNPLNATTYGVGELIAHAVRNGARKIIIGLGGSATSDCGTGMLNAITDIFGGNMESFDVCIPDVTIDVLSDVTNPLYGNNGAAAVFGPQKGATPDVVRILDSRARKLASKARKRQGHDMSMAPGAGAAGGLGYALMQFMGAEIHRGAEYFLNLVNFDDMLDDSSLVITGEGSADKQTLMGKIPSAILTHAQNLNIPVCIVAGKVKDNEKLLAAGFSEVICINDGLPEGISPLNRDVAIEQLRKTAGKLRL